MKTEENTAQAEEPVKDEKKSREREGVLAGTSRARLEEIKENIAMAEGLIAESEKSGDAAALKVQRLVLEEYQLDLELFWAEHDNAGAFKMKKFDRELREQFEITPESEREPFIKKGEDGKFELAESAKDRRMLFVDMLELDRLNKDGGGHDAGDIGLAQTVEIIKQAAISRLGDKQGTAARFEVFRSGGNQFMVNFEKISPEDFQAIATDIAKNRADITEKIGKNVEGAPLAVTPVEFASVIEDLNAIQTEAGDIAEGDEAAREIMQVMLRSGDWGSEVRKYATRAGRVREKLNRGDADTKEFFDNYVSKMMKGTKLESLEAFKQAEFNGDFEGTVRDGGLTAARSRFALDREFEAKEDASVTDRVRREIVRSRTEARRVGEKRIARTIHPPGHWAANLFDELDVLEHGKIAEVPKETNGQEALRQAKEKATAARAALDQAMDAKAPDDEIAELTAKAGIAKRKSNIVTARRNAGTGLLERGVYYEKLESALENKEPVTSVFIDMGMLKYYDQKGGVEVANEGLKSAAYLIEQAIKESGVEGEAYRYGGDEFTALLKGTKEDAKKFTTALDRLKSEFGRISADSKSKDEYIPTELIFNVGMSDASELSVTLESSGRRDAPWNKKAEVLTKIADTRIEFAKGVSRFELLLGQMARPGFQDAKISLEEGTKPDLASRQIEAKVEYSRKGIFAELGGETALRIFAEELRRENNPQKKAELATEIEDQIRRFVLDRVEMSHKKDAEKKQLLDRLVESRTTISYYEEERGRLTRQYNAEHVKVVSLEASLTKARKDFEALKQVRSDLAA